VNFDFFGGWGFGVSVGYDTKTCQPFITGRLGGGLKFGVDFDPRAGRPGVVTATGPRSGTTFGPYVQGGASIGIAGLGIGGEAKSSLGRDFGSNRGWIAPPWAPDVSGQFGYEPGGKTGFGGGFSTGFEAGYYGSGGSECGCKK
jgi:hypothetical protein